MANVKPIPDGFGTLTPFLNIKGAAEAIEFYKKAFGAEEESRMAGPNGVVMHAVLRIGGSALMLSDAVREAPTQSSLHLYVEDADAWFQRATAAGAKAAVPLQDMFWGHRYGIVVDPWGNRWAIATQKEVLSASEMQRRGDEMMAKMP